MYFCQRMVRGVGGKLHNMSYFCLIVKHRLSLKNLLLVYLGIIVCIYDEHLLIPNTY